MIMVDQRYSPTLFTAENKKVKTCRQNIAIKNENNNFNNDGVKSIIIIIKKYNIIDDDDNLGIMEDNNCK